MGETIYPKRRLKNPENADGPVIITNICSVCKTETSIEVENWLKSFGGLTMCDTCIANQTKDRETKISKQKNQEKKNKILEVCNIPEEFRMFDNSKSDLQVKTWVKTTLQYNPQKWLWLAGEERMGKSRSLAYFGWQAANKGKLVYWCQMPTWVDNMVKNKLLDGKEARKELYLAKEADITIIDDLDKFYVTKARVSIIWDIINTRHIADLPVWITSNSGGATIQEMFDAVGGKMGRSLVGRLAEKCEQYKNAGETE